MIEEYGKEWFNFWFIILEFSCLILLLVCYLCAMIFPAVRQFKSVQECLYTIYTKLCEHPFKLVDSAISATPVAD